MAKTNKIVYHWVTNKENMGADNINQVKNEGLIKTELKIAPRSDKHDMDYVWLSSNPNCSGAVCSIAKSILQQICPLEKAQGYPATREEIASVEANSNRMRTDTKFVRYAFKAEDIDATHWPIEREAWIDNVSSKRRFADKIDQTSIVNGDDINDYYVTSKDIDISKAISVEEFDMSFSQMINHVHGLDNLYDLYQHTRTVVEDNNLTEYSKFINKWHNTDQPESRQQRRARERAEKKAANRKPGHNMSDSQLDAYRLIKSLMEVA